MPAGSATATTLLFAPKVELDLSSNEVNLTTAVSAGHRIEVNISKALMNSSFTWARALNSKAPTATYAAAGEFMNTIGAALASVNDIDGVSGGLDLTTSSLCNDPRLAALDAGDRLLASYILYKGYGKSAFDTSGLLLNTEDLSGMLSQTQLVLAIDQAFIDGNTEPAVKSDIQAMFEDLLVADPLRFFDASGNQIPGLFETNVDVAGSGNWNFTDGDKIQVKVELKFKADVNVQGVDVLDNGAGSQTAIKTDDVFAFRLQLTVSG